MIRKHIAIRRTDFFLLVDCRDDFKSEKGGKRDAVPNVSL